MVIEVDLGLTDRLSQELTYPRWPVASKINPSAQIHVRLGHSQTLRASIRDVRFTPESRHSTMYAACPESQ
jgi:hypothetical protein